MDYKIDMEKITPMMKQYFKVKEQYKDCILLYRLGDFYEMFFDDALIASKVLEISLTGRNCGLEERAPMCGVPFHAVDGYVAKLISAGYSAAICEQAEDPAEAKGIVKREVCRVITPGTIMSAVALDGDKNNYISSVYIGEEEIGIAFADITTGECSVCEIETDNYEISLMNEMAKYMPKEVIINLRGFENSGFCDDIRSKTGGTIRNYYDWAFEYAEAERKIIMGYGSLSEVGLEDKKGAISAIGGLFTYLEDTQKTKITNLKNIEVNRDSNNMKMDMYTLRNLEINETLRERATRGSLLHTLNKTKTSMGSRLMRKWLTAPLMNCIAIQNRHGAVGELIDEPIVRAEITEALKHISDMERLVNRAVYRQADCRDLLALKASLKQLPPIVKSMANVKSRFLKECLKKIDVLDDICEIIEKTIREDAPTSLRNGGMILKGANSELDRVMELRDNGQGIINDLVEKEKEKTGIKNLKLGYNKVFGYYVEVTKSYQENVPEYFIRKQTLTNAERYITPELKEVEEAVLEASTKAVDMEYELFCQVRDIVGQAGSRIQKTSAAIGALDVICSFATVAEKNGYVKPVVNNGDKIIIKDGRHPVVENLAKNTLFIPNDTSMNCEDNRISIITGPNMAGKSTYMRQTALIVLMAQAGSFVPASSAEIGIVDRIFTRVGASDDLSSGQSTFMVEMNEVAYILDNATKNSLIVLDEIGRGTSTFDGLGIAWAVIEYIADKKKCGARTMFATHYHELTDLEESMDGVKNYCVAVKKNGETISFLRKIIRGGADRSYGVDVAALAGVKKSVVKRAAEIVEQLEKEEVGQVTVKQKNVKNIAQEDFQIDFFGATENPIIEELKEIDIDTMTPVEALTKLYDLKAKAINGK